MADTKIADSEPLVVIVRAFPMCKADKLNDFLVKNADRVGKMHSISSGGIKLPRQGIGRENADRVGKLIHKRQIIGVFLQVEEGRMGRTGCRDVLARLSQGRNGVESRTGLIFPIRKIRCKGVNFTVYANVCIKNKHFFGQIIDKLASKV